MKEKEKKKKRSKTTSNGNWEMGRGHLTGWTTFTHA
jgi:hypothetical protein